MGSYLVCGERENNSKTVSNVMSAFINLCIGKPNDKSGTGWALEKEDFSNLILSTLFYMQNKECTAFSLFGYEKTAEHDAICNKYALEEILQDFAYELSYLVLSDEKYVSVRWE